MLHRWLNRWLFRASLTAAFGVALAQAPDSAALPSPEPIYAQRCAVCHGENAVGTERAPALTGNRRLRPMTTAQIHDLIKNGTAAGMPPFNIPEPELQSLTLYLRGMNAAPSTAGPT